MPIFRNKRFTLNAGFCILVSLFLLLLPLKWVVSWFLAAAFHELCHCLALRLCGVKIYSVSVGFSGAEIDTEPMCNRQELVSALAGPMGGLLLFAFLRYMPTLAICALVQSVYNLLPVFPFDGGRVLRCCISAICGQARAVKISDAVTKVFLMILFVLSWLLAIKLKMGIYPVALVILLMLNHNGRKFPCKPVKQIVQ